MYAVQNWASTYLEQADLSRNMCTYIPKKKKKSVTNQLKILPINSFTIAPDWSLGTVVYRRKTENTVFTPNL